MQNKSGNRFENLLSEDSKENNVIEEANNLHGEPAQNLHVSNSKPRDNSKGRWKPISVKKKIISPVQVHLAKKASPWAHGYRGASSNISKQISTR